MNGYDSSKKVKNFRRDTVEISYNKTLVSGERFAVKFKKNLLDSNIWNSMMEFLYSERVYKWQKAYINTTGVAGTLWEMIIKFDDGKELSFSGSNSFPENWSVVDRRMQEVAAHKKLWEARNILIKLSSSEYNEKYMNLIHSVDQMMESFIEAPKEEIIEKNIVCPNCGSMLNSSDMFCAFCGFKLG